MPRGKWLCVLCHSKSPAKKKAASKKANRVSESSECTAVVAADKIAAETSETPSAAAATTPVATPSPRRSSSAVALKRSLNQAIAKEKDLAPCRYKG